MTEENKNIKKFPNSGNIPKLRFSEFTEEWGTKTLGKIGEVVNGLTYSPNDIDEHGVLVLRSSNVQNRTITFTDNVFVKANNFNPVKENDILICVRNGSKNLIGKNALIKKQNEGLAFGAFMAIYRSEFNRFLFQWFDTKDYKDIVNKNLGATINSINGGDLKKFKVPFPSLKEQEKIASFLSLIDERILSQKKIIEKLETLMKASRENIFSQKLRFKNENDGFYSEWKSTQLKNITQIFDGTHQTPKYVKKGVPFYSVENVTANNFSVTKYISEEVFTKENNRVKIEKGDILMTRIGDIGTVKYIDWNVKASFYVSLALIKNNNNYHSKYLAQYISSEKFQNELWNRTIHVAFPKKINLGEIGECLLKIPCIEEQIKIANFLSSIQEKIETEKQILEKLELQKKFLLGNLFV